MKAIVIEQPGGPEVLQLAERTIPDPAPNEVLLKVHAAGVNRPDIAQREGRYPAPPGAPVDVPGLEVAGEVAKVGSYVRDWQIGDKVCALLSGGGYAEYACVDSQLCLPVPNGMTYLQAASIPETFFTVWSNVFDRGGFKSGDKVLVHGGTSGIGVAAIQIITAMDGIVYTTAGTNEKCHAAERIGAKKAINYKNEDFYEVIKKLEPDGIQIVLDMVGGEYTQKNLDLLAPDGHLVMINAMGGRFAQVDLMKLMVKRLTLTGSTLRAREVSFKAAIAEKLRKHIWPLLENGTIKPIIHAEFPLIEAGRAHEMMEKSVHIGKIVLVPE